MRFADCHDSTHLQTYLGKKNANKDIQLECFENVKYGCLGKSSSVNRGGPCPVVPRIYELEPDDIPELLQTCKSFAAFFGDI